MSLRKVLARPAVGLLVVGALVAVAACAPTADPPTGGPTSPSSPTPSGLTESSSPDGSAPGAASGSDVWLPEWADLDSPVPATVADRRPLPFCGVERAPAPQPGIFIDRAVRLCFWNAHLAGAEAEFVSIQSTIEGGTIATIYRRAADGTIELLTDMTQDPFGGGGWIRTTCSRLVEGEGDELLGVADCDEGSPIEE